jgi:drug/metabolite transporter (DMT)-like permease
MNVVLGIAAAVAASACYNAGVVMQAREAREEPLQSGLRPSLIASLVRRRRWALGTALTIAGWPLQTAALLVAPLTVVQPSLAAGLLLLLFLGHRQLGERVARREVVGVAAIGCGVAIVAAAAPHTSESDLDGAGVAALTALAAVSLVPYALRTLRPLSGTWVAVAAGGAYAWAAIASKLLADALSGGRLGGSIAWAGAVGLVSMLAISSEMTALQTRPATQVAPLLFAVETLIPVLLAPVVAGEQWWAHAWMATSTLVALALVVTGSTVLARSPLVRELVDTEQAAEEPQPRPAGRLGAEALASARAQE